MASTLDFVEHVIGTLGNIGELRSRKMFGEYMIYLNDKPIITVCDNTPFVKIHPGVAEISPDLKTGFPYDGAKEHYILDLDNPEKAREIALFLETITPLPKKRKKQSSEK